jgi:apolipoprotein D and lipocalin family protein
VGEEKMRKIFLALLSLILAGCHGYPKAVTPVKYFDIGRYLGKWYEIARLDHSFERGLEQVTAEYTLQDNGQVKVVNRGFSRSTNEWKEAVGKAYFSRETDEGYLKVSFFGPFYSSYVVFELDRENYQYAFISGPNESYLWLLSRTPSVDKDVMALFVKTADEMGFNTEELIYVQQKE